MVETSWETVMAYHEATKHHFHRYARSAGYMDWNNQPNPFRSYEGAVRTPLPLCRQDPDLPYHDLFTPAPDAGKELTPASLGSFLELSLGLSAWKAVGSSRWSLRINPSSGNLHPTEGHLVIPELSDIEGGVYHYDPLASPGRGTPRIDRLGIGSPPCRAGAPESAARLGAGPGWNRFFRYSQRAQSQGG